MENKNIEYSVDPREFQMRLIMNLPKNTPKAAMEVISETQRHRDFLLEQNEQLKDTIDRDSGCEENARLRKERDFLLEQNEKFKNSSTRESESTPEDITNYMKELEGEIEDLKEEACDYESMKKHRDTLLEQSEETFMKVHNLEEENKKLKENQLTEENAMDYIYQHSDQYEDWIEESDLYISIWKEHKELKEEHEKLKLLAQPLFRAILNHENN